MKRKNGLLIGLLHCSIILVLVGVDWPAAVRAQTGNCTPPPPGLVSWWQLEGNWADSIGMNAGVPGGNFAFGPGKVGSAMTFDGSSDYVQIPASSSVNVGASPGFTIEAWIKPADVTFDQPLVEWNNSAGYTGVQLWLAFATANTGPRPLYANVVESNGAYHIFSSAPGLVASNTFQHVALTYAKASGVGVLYLNGTIVAQSYLGTFTPATDTDLWLGVRPPSAYLFRGSMDEVSLYNRALSQPEIQAIYAAGSSGKCPAYNLVVPAQYTNLEAAGESGILDESAREQTVYSASYFPASPILVREIRFRPNGADAPSGHAFDATISHLHINLSTTPRSPDGLSATFGENVGSDDTIVFDGSASISSSLSGPSEGPKTADIRIPLTTPFLYDPSAGNLLVDIRNFSGESTTPVDASSSVSDSASRVSSTDVNAVSGNADSGGDVLTLLYTVTTSNQSPRIVSQPTNQIVAVGATATFSVGAIGSGPLSYQWMVNKTNLVGETNASLVLDNVQTNQSGSLYSVRVTNDFGFDVSSNALLTVALPVAPTITNQPSDQVATVGDNVVFSVGVTGTPPLSYQWRFNGTNLPAATNATLALNDVQMSQAGKYSVEVTNVAGFADSSSATLTVNYPPAVVRLTSINSPAASTVTVPVQLVANGNEYAIAFSLSILGPVNFDINATRVTLGSGAQGASLMVNTNQLSSGRLGIQIVQPPFTTFAPGVQDIANITLVVSNATVSAHANLSFTDQPIPRQLVDGMGAALPASFQSGAIVSVAPAQTLEADVSPRFATDRLVSLSDWLQIGRFAVGLDSVNIPSEFQKADCAPRATSGDGRISVADWVQAARYASGWDPLTPSGGPVSESSNSVAASDLRKLTLAAATFTPATSGEVDVNLAAQGDENAVAFSLAFDPAAIGFVAANLGTNMDGAVLLLNTNAIALGHLGIAVALPVGTTLPAGSQNVLGLAFTPHSDAGGSSDLTFTNASALVEVSDAFGNPLPVAAEDSAISVQPLEPPALSISVQAGTVRLMWPLSASAFELQTSGMIGASDTWTNIVETTLTNGDQLSVELPLEQTPQFFRLTMP